jgi:hypothetical protein
LTVITHMAVGAAAGSFLEHPVAAAAVGAGTHVVLDVLPHYEFEKLWVELAAVITVLGGLLLAGLGGTGLFWGVVGAAVPDAENLAWRMGLLPGRFKVFPGHTDRLSRVLPHGRALPPRHALTQVALITACVAIVALRMRAGAV